MKWQNTIIIWGLWLAIITGGTNYGHWISWAAILIGTMLYTNDKEQNGNH